MGAFLGNPFVTFPVVGGSFLPSDLTNITMWLNADDNSSFNGGSITGGDGISDWTDPISSYVLEQTTGADQCIYRASGQNSKPYVETNGSNQRMRETGIMPWSVSGPNYMIFVCRYYNTGNARVLGFREDPSIYQFEFERNGGTGVRTNYVFADTKGTTDYTGDVHIIRFGYVSGTLTIHVDGTLESTKSIGAKSYNGTNGNFAIGLADGNAGGKIDLYELVTVGGSMTPTEITDLETYFNTKYDL